MEWLINSKLSCSLLAGLSKTLKNKQRFTFEISLNALIPNFR